MRRIAVSNQKGGVGKTTTTANLGACLAELGQRVLLIDMDPQANLSVHVGVEISRDDPSTYTLLRGEHPFSDALRDTVVPGLQIVPSTIDLAGLEVELSTRQSGRERCLAEAIAGLDGQYDYMLVDCPPSLGLLTLNSMCAVNEIFIPLQTEFFALQGLGRLMSTVQLVQSVLSPQVRITGIVPTMFDVRTSLAVEVLQDIQSHFGDKVFDTVVRKNIRLAEAPSYGVPITMYDPTCYGAEDYRSLARETLAMEGKWIEAPVRGDVTPPVPACAGEEDVPLAEAV